MIALVSTIAVIYMLMPKPIGIYGLLLFGFLLVVTLLFSSMTVKVEDESLVWYLGPKFWKNKISLSEIASVSSVKTKGYWGFGVHLTLNGWLYKVSGDVAVKVVLKSGKSILIGTADSDSLISALRNDGN